MTEFPFEFFFFLLHTPTASFYLKSSRTLDTLHISSAGTTQLLKSSESGHQRNSNLSQLCPEQPSFFNRLPLSSAKLIEVYSTFHNQFLLQAYITDPIAMISWQELWSFYQSSF